jgi:hypothetical protein
VTNTLAYLSSAKGGASFIGFLPVATFRTMATAEPDLDEDYFDSLGNNNFPTWAQCYKTFYIRNLRKI